MMWGYEYRPGKPTNSFVGAVRVNEIKNLFEAFVADATKAEAGNVAAGRRARKVSLEIADALKTFRKESVKWAKEK